MQQDIQTDWATDTSEDAESIPIEKCYSGSDRILNINSFEKVFKPGNLNRMQTDGDRDDEKDEIIRGFIIEKDYIKQEHEKEKEKIVDNFIKDREELLDKFNDQVSALEEKLSSTHQQPVSLKTRPRVMKNANVPGPTPLLIDTGRTIVNAEEFLCNYKLEEQFDSEKDELERQFREERRALKEKLELELNRKLQSERLRFKDLNDDLKRTISDLKYEKGNLEMELKRRNDEFKIVLEEERRKSASQHILEIEKMKFQQRGDQDNYKRLMNEAKEDVRRLNAAMSKKEEEFLRELKEINEKQADEFQRKYEKCLHEKSTLDKEIENLKKENREMNNSIKIQNEMKTERINVLDEVISRLNEEYKERLKNSVLENQDLHRQLQSVRQQNENYRRVLKKLEDDICLMENKHISKDALLSGYGEKLSALRLENNQLAEEIYIIKKKNENTRETMEKQKETEKLLREKITETDRKLRNIEHEYKIIEREKTGLEEVISLVNLKLKDTMEEKEILLRNVKQLEEREMVTETLLAQEHKENNRLNERFQQDTAEIRKKETECNLLKKKLMSKERINEEKINANVKKIETLLHVEDENCELRKRLAEIDTNKESMLLKEKEIIQKQFVREFTNRLQLLRHHYEDATDGLVQQIKNLRKKIAELELTIRPRTKIYGKSFEKEQPETNLGNRYKEINREINNNVKEEAVRDHANSGVEKKALDEEKSQRPYMDAIFDNEKVVNRESIQFNSHVPAFSFDLSNHKNESHDKELVYAMQQTRPLRRRTLSCDGIHYNNHPVKCNKYGISNDNHQSSEGDFNNRYGNAELYSNEYSSDKKYFNQKPSKYGFCDVKFGADYKQTNYSSPVCKSAAKNASSSDFNDMHDQTRPRRHHCNQDDSRSQNKHVEKSVERLQDRLETSHSQLLQKIEGIRNSPEIQERVTLPNTQSGNWKDSKLKDQYVHNLEKREHLWKIDVLEREAKTARKYASDLNEKLQEKKIEVDDTTKALSNLYKTGLNTLNDKKYALPPTTNRERKTLKTDGSITELQKKKPVEQNNNEIASDFSDEMLV